MPQRERGKRQEERKPVAKGKGISCVLLAREQSLLLKLRYKKLRQEDLGWRTAWAMEQVQDQCGLH